MNADDTEAPPPGGVREAEHSGDVALELWGATHAELLARATEGLCRLMTWSAVEPVSSRRLEVRAADFTDLLVDWLSAVILSAATHAELYAGATVHVSDDGLATGVLHAAPLDPAQHRLRFDVKAATYHGLTVEQTAAGYHARVVFDL
jgi:SHS2 domain-containing protein